MRILIVSDSHFKECNEAIALKNPCDILIHCGDSQLNFKHDDLKKYDYKVRGNCDFDTDFPEEVFFECDGIKFYVVHGHKQNVGYSSSNILDSSKDAKFIFHGHTHILSCEELENKVIINPGSVSSSRSNYTETFAILNVENSKYKVEIIDFYSNNIIEVYEGKL